MLNDGSLYFIVFVDGLMYGCCVVLFLDIVNDAGKLLPNLVDLRCFVHIFACKQVATRINAFLLAIELEDGPGCALFLEVLDD